MYFDFEVSTKILGSGSRTLFFGQVLLLIGLTSSVRMPLSEGFGNRPVEASEQLSHLFFLTSKQHGHSLTTAVGDRHAPNRAHVAKGDLAMLHEFLDVGQALV
jgi:hypothetical protein